MMKVGSNHSSSSFLDVKGKLCKNGETLVGCAGLFRALRHHHPEEDRNELDAKITLPPGCGGIVVSQIIMLQE